MIVTCLLAALLSAGNAEFDQTSKEGAYAIALGREKARLIADGPPSGALAKAMLAQPEAFAKVGSGREAAWKVYGTMLDAEYAVRARLAAERLGLTNRVSEKIMFSAAAREAARKRFEAHYVEERASACAQQAATLAGRLSPSVYDIESKGEAALRQEMGARVAAQQKGAVFEENYVYISEKIVEPVLAAAKRERKRQGDYLRRARCEAYAPSAVAEELTARLVANVKSHAAAQKAGGVQWGVFPSVTNTALPTVVKRRVMERFTAQTAETPYAISGDAVAKTLVDDAPHHRRLSDSQAIFRRLWANDLTVRSLRALCEETPEGERKELVAYLAKNRSDAALVKTVAQRLNEEFLPQLARIRSAVAEEAFTNHWPALANRSWYPDAATADDMSARSDFAAAVRGWRALPTVDLPKGEDVLEEASALADRSVADAFALARVAVVAQRRTVDEVSPAVREEAQRRKSSFWHRTPDLERIVAMLTEAVENRWSETKVSLLWPDGAAPENATSQHAELFPSVRRYIEQTAKIILAEINPSDPDAKPEVPQTMYSILISRQDDRISLKLSNDGETLLERETKARMEEFRAAMREAGEKLGVEVMELK